MRWEYSLVKLVMPDNDWIEAMDLMGQDGWELATIYENTAYFKRPIYGVYDDQITSPNNND